MTLPRDATIESVIKTLRHPIDYVCGVLGHMHLCRKSYGNASVRIGVSGTGKRPYYRVMYMTECGANEVFDTFFDNHISFQRENLPITGGDDWSDATMNFVEVAALRGKLRFGR